MNAETLARIKEKVRGLPEEPGVYLMRDVTGKVIYVGKAKVLKNRVSQYFVNMASHTEKVRRMVSHVHDFDYFITPTEMEALILECSQIKLYMPRYNILLKDNKTYPYIRVDLTQPYPKIEFTRRRAEDRARYFGPYSGSVRAIIETVNKTFGLPSCKREFPRDIGKGRPCLNRDIGICLAPCAGGVSQEEYRAAVEGAVAFLAGDQDAVLRDLTAQMNEAAERLEFERAASLRDRIAAVSNLQVRQKVVAAPDVNRDIIGYAANAFKTVIEVFFVRGGRITDRQSFHFPAEAADELPALMTDFVTQLYHTRADIPGEILAAAGSDNDELLRQLLTGLRGRSVSFSVPQRGEKKKLCDMVCRNAAETLRLLMTREEKRRKSVEGLGQLLGLAEPPVRIEAVDISNTGGDEVVAAIVCFTNGEKDKSGYKKYKVQSVEGQDDYAAMTEVLKRRFIRYLNADEGFAEKPDLLLLDGGAGHLAVIGRTLAEMGIDVPCFGMVKDDKHRTRGLVGEQGEIELKMGTPAAVLVGTIQEEVHRFAITFHRARRGKKVVGSTLLAIDGLGEKRVAALLRAFSTVRAVSEAEPESLAAVPGMNRAAAAAVWRHFHGDEEK